MGCGASTAAAVKAPPRLSVGPSALPSSANRVAKDRAKMTRSAHGNLAVAMEEAVQMAHMYREFAAARRTPWIDTEQWLQDEVEGSELRVRTKEHKATPQGHQRKRGRKREGKEGGKRESRHGAIEGRDRCGLENGETRGQQ